MAMNAKSLGLAAALVLAACDRQPTERANTVSAMPAPSAISTSDVAHLAADRAALDQAHARCKARAPGATPDLCAAAAEATRRRFSGSASAYVPAAAAANPHVAKR
jgi:hypothetical protein